MRKNRFEWAIVAAFVLVALGTADLRSQNTSMQAPFSIDSERGRGFPPVIMRKSTASIAGCSGVIRGRTGSVHPCRPDQQFSNGFE